MFGISALIGLIFSFFSTFAFIKYFILCDLRLNQSGYKSIFDIIKSNKQFILYEEITDEKTYPSTYLTIVFNPKVWFYIGIQTNEGSGTISFNKNATIQVKCLRWQKNRILDLLSFSAGNKIPVQILYTSGKDTVGYITKESPAPLQDKNIWEDIENEVQKVHRGELNKTGILMYGKPGNGKTTFVKYLAHKYKFPINIMNLRPDLSNNDLMLVFSQVRPHSILLLEDFDNIFEGRKLLMSTQNQQLTFDAILNSLDGVFNEYNSNIFIMTVNDINKVDNALKCRPNRFKFVREFGPVKVNIPDIWKREDLNLDQLLRLEEFYKSGLTKEDSYFRLNLC